LAACNINIYTEIKNIKEQEIYRYNIQ